MASSVIAFAFPCPPGVPLSPTPNTSLFTAPSIWMLLSRFPFPAMDGACSNVFA